MLLALATAAALAADVADATGPVTVDGRLDEATWAAYRHAMFGGDFMFNTTRAQAAECRVPALVCMGNDIYHPAPISRELAMLLPNARFVEHWKEPEHLEQTDRTIRAFLADHS